MEISLAFPGAGFNDGCMNDDGSFPAINHATSWSLDRLAFNWFDVALVIVLAFGFWRGRKRGMSREFLPAMMWLILVLGAGFGYPILGDQLLQLGVINAVFGNHFRPQTAAFVCAYLFIALAVFLFVLFLNRIYKTKLEGGNAFGSGEYYLGMIAGTVRYACILLAVLALLNAPFYSAAEIQATKDYNKRWLGGGMYEGNYLPNLQTLQANVFTESILGPIIRNHLSILLIDTGAATTARREGR